MIYLEFEDGEILDLDCVDDLSPSYSVDKTTHEVEDGSEVTDNINVKPDIVTIRGFYSNVPLTAGGTFDPEAEGPHTAFLARMERAIKDGEVLTLIAGVFGVWPDMQITSFDPNFMVETGSGVNYSISLEQVRIVNAKVEVNRPDPGKNPDLRQPRGRTTADRLGEPSKAPATTPTDPTATQGAQLTAAIRF